MAESSLTKISLVVERRYLNLLINTLLEMIEEKNLDIDNRREQICKLQLKNHELGMSMSKVIGEKTNERTNSTDNTDD